MSSLDSCGGKYLACYSTVSYFQIVLLALLLLEFFISAAYMIFIVFECVSAYVALGYINYFL